MPADGWTTIPAGLSTTSRSSSSYTTGSGMASGTRVGSGGADRVTLQQLAAGQPVARPARPPVDQRPAVAQQPLRVCSRDARHRGDGHVDPSGGGGAFQDPLPAHDHAACVVARRSRIGQVQHEADDADHDRRVGHVEGRPAEAADPTETKSVTLPSTSRSVRLPSVPPRTRPRRTAATAPRSRPVRCTQPMATRVTRPDDQEQHPAARQQPECRTLVLGVPDLDEVTDDRDLLTDLDVGHDPCLRQPVGEVDHRRGCQQQAALGPRRCGTAHGSCPSSVRHHPARRSARRRVAPSSSTSSRASAFGRSASGPMPTETARVSSASQARCGASRREPPRGGHADLDPVADLEAGRLPQVLEPMGDLAGKALGGQLSSTVVSSATNRSPSSAIS